MQNIRSYDRLLRFSIAILFIYLSNIDLNIYLVFAIILFITGIAGYCPVYRLLHINLAFQRKNDFLKELPKNNPEPVFLFSKNGEILYQNKASKDILPNITIFSDLSQESPQNTILNQTKTYIKHQYNNKIYMMEISGDKKKSYIFSYGFNITEIQKSKDRLKEQNITDSLTKLGNRTKLIEDINKNVNDELNLVIFDIVNFSQINGFYGHKKGDEFLIQFADQLNDFQSNLNFHSFAYRLRGNTFALLVNFKNYNKKDKSKFIQNILNELFSIFSNYKIKVNNITTSLNIRVGIASKCDVIEEKVICLSLINNAETSLSEAKLKSVPYIFFEDISNIHNKYKENLNWASKLHDIFDKKSDSKIKAYYQPIYNLKSKQIEKFEALVRIEEGEDVISPFMFLDIAKQIHYLPKITQEVLSQAMSTFQGSKFEFSINITTQDLKNKEFVTWITKFIQKNNFNPSSIVLEILEDEDIYEYTDTITSLKEKGFKIAIDDFGVGYSNFKKLQLLNVDYIKIDGSLIKNIVTNPKDFSIINSICAYAKAIDVKTIAEFVANEEIFKLLKDSDVDYVQGYYISEPSPKLMSEFHG